MIITLFPNKIQVVLQFFCTKVAIKFTKDQISNGTISQNTFTRSTIYVESLYYEKVYGF